MNIHEATSRLSATIEYCPPATATGMRITNVRTIRLPIGAVLRFKSSETCKLTEFEVSQSPTFEKPVERRTAMETQNVMLLASGTSRQVSERMLTDGGMQPGQRQPILKWLHKLWLCTPATCGNVLQTSLRIRIQRAIARPNRFDSGPGHHGFFAIVLIASFATLFAKTFLPLRTQAQRCRCNAASQAR